MSFTYVNLRNIHFIEITFDLKHSLNSIQTTETYASERKQQKPSILYDK